MKNWHGNFDLFIKKYYNEASTTTTHLLAYIYQEFGDSILSILTLFYQDQALSCTQVDGKPLFEEEKALEEANKMVFDFIIPIDDN